MRWKEERGLKEVVCRKDQGHEDVLGDKRDGQVGVRDKRNDCDDDDDHDDEDGEWRRRKKKRR